MQTLLRKDKIITRLILEIIWLVMEDMLILLEETRMSYARSVSFLVMELTNAEIGLIILLFQNKAEVLQEASDLEVDNFLEETLVEEEYDEDSVEIFLEIFLEVEISKDILHINHHHSAISHK